MRILQDEEEEELNTRGIELGEDAEQMGWGLVYEGGCHPLQVLVHTTISGCFIARLTLDQLHIK